MQLLQRYVLWELLKVFGVVLTGFTLLLVFAGVYAQAKEHGLGPWQILQILPFVAPTLFPFTIPTALLLTVCVVYGRMSGDREVIASKAAGIHILSLIWPSFFLGGALSVVTLVVTDQMIPWSMARIERTVTLAMEDIFLDMLRAQNQVNFRDRGLSITVMDVRDRTLIVPTFRYSPKGKPAITLQAKEATLKFDLQRDVVVMNLVHGHIDLPGRPRMWFENDVREFPLPSRKQKPKPRNLPVREIREELDRLVSGKNTAAERRAVEAALLLTTGEFDRLADRGFLLQHMAVFEEQDRRLKLRSELHTRFAMSSSCFFFVLFGSPFAILMAKKQFLTSFLFCFVPILLVYYPLSMMTQNLSKSDQLNPVWAVWVANGVLAVASAVVLRRVIEN